MTQQLSPFCQQTLELADTLGHASARRMFGSVGLFMNGLMFGLVSPDDGLYIKTDDQTRGTFVAAGCLPFTYTSRNKGEVALSYYRLPDVEDEDAVCDWMRLGLQAAQRQGRKSEEPSDDPWRSLIR